MDKIEKIQNKINELQKELNELKQENQPVKRWRAELGEDYWHVGNSLIVKSEQEQGHSIDNGKYQLGNYFKTEQEAQDYLDNMLTKQELKDLALELNNGVEIDWENREQRKYFIIYDNDDKELVIEFRHDRQNLGQVYCLDQNFLEVAKERIGEDRLIKLIKSGV